MNRNKERVLLYHFGDKEQCRKMKFVLLSLKMSGKVIPYEAYNKTIGYHLGEDTPEALEDAQKGAYQGKEFAEPMMVMNGITGYRLDQLLSAMRKAGLPRISYKAVVTEHNIHWTAEKLYQELVQEHAKVEEERSR